MKTLKHLEKSRYIWFLITVCVVFFILRLPSLIEPNWYGDEGIYQVIGQALQKGRVLYSGIWDNKPPLLYFVYALFSSDQFTIRLVSLMFGITATIVFFFLAQKLFKNDKASIITTILFTLLFATPYLEGNIANAENFMLLPILTAAFLTYRFSSTIESGLHHHQKFLFALTSRPSILIAGLLLGFAFLFKIVAVFDFTALVVFFLITLHKESPVRGKNIWKRAQRLVSHALYFLIPFISGFLLPIIITFLYFTFSGSLVAFVQAAFFGNIDYVGYGNNFIIPQGLLIIKICLFVFALGWIFIKGQSLPKPTFFIVLWFVFAVFSAFFSQRPYTHYLLVLLPSFCLMTGLLFTSHSTRLKSGIGVLLLCIVFIAVTYFPVYNKTFLYYQNVYQFLSGKEKVRDYQAFFDQLTPRDYEVVSYINRHTTPNDQIFLWGDSPQIYALTKKLPPGRYVVSYHIREQANAFEETQAAIDQTKPKFIITLSEAPPIPFRLSNYTGTYGIKGAAIYERTY